MNINWLSFKTYIFSSLYLISLTEQKQSVIVFSIFYSSHCILSWGWNITTPLCESVKYSLLSIAWVKENITFWMYPWSKFPIQEVNNSEVQKSRRHFSCHSAVHEKEISYFLSSLWGLLKEKHAHNILYKYGCSIAVSLFQSLESVFLLARISDLLDTSK